MMETPPFPLVTAEDTASVVRAMQRLGLWDADENLDHVERAGEGNMNLTLRVATSRRCVILKQSRPWVEKYPSIKAPVDRIRAETDFYVRVADCESICAMMPQMLASDGPWHLLALEDLGRASDYSDLYTGEQPDAMPLEETTAWLAQLHAVPVDPKEREEIGNFALRELNHAHIFVIPLQSPSAIPLDDVCDGLEQLAERIRGNSGIHQVFQELGQRYLESGEHLLHGDYYPGSWLRTSQGLRVIDPEFTFAGPAEFDLGVLAAHCVLIGGDEPSIDSVCQSYRASGGVEIDKELMRRFAGIEIIRRLIGVAQLPLRAGIRERTKMIEVAERLIAA